LIHILFNDVLVLLRLNY